jgi:hypothetical protein
MTERSEARRREAWAEQGRLWGVRGATTPRGMDRCCRLYVLLVSRRLGLIAS